MTDLDAEHDLIMRGIPEDSNASLEDALRSGALRTECEALLSSLMAVQGYQPAHDRETSVTLAYDHRCYVSLACRFRVR